MAKIKFYGDLKRFGREPIELEVSNFRELMSGLLSQISGLREQFEQLPQAVTAINNLKELPKQMQRLLDDVNASNQKIVSELRRALPSVVIQGGSTSGNNLAASPIVQPVLPSWLKWLLAVAIIVIMMASIFSSYTTWQMSLRPNSTKVVASSQDSVVMVDSLQKDTVKK